jgi:hypothetical protein
MAQINWLKGSLNGKLGAVVGSTYKGIEYVKTYTKPADPKTPEQMAVRNIFTRTAHRAGSISYTVLKPYVFPKLHKMSEYNQVIAWNKDNFKTKVWDPAHFAIFEGQLPGQRITGVTYDPATLSLVASTDYGGAGPRDTDTAILVIWNSETDELIGVSTGEKRNAGSITCTVFPGVIQAGISYDVYLAYTELPDRNAGIKGNVSNTSYWSFTLPEALIGT